MSDNPENDKMPLTAHLEELRKRLLRSLIAAFIAFGICYNFKERLFEVLTRPLVESIPKNSYMIYTSLPEAFFNYLKISFFAGLVVASPYILYQIWKFISPGLYASEKKHVVPFVLTSTILFVSGVLFGYFLALPPAFKFFLEFSTDFLKPMLTLREYLSLSLKLLLAFGIVFEIPVFIFFLAKIGVVNAALLRKQRKYAILLIFIVAALITPTPDAFSQTLMAVPMMILYEVGIIVAKWGEKKTAGGEAKEAPEGLS
ncbi:MAG TPA: twin-arginine translocase subunit TatC [Syntrophales bacterium]|nr:twin-arginine translocase subunit TatC [Syntrophobacterales bacterium]HRR40513.1 twin-arginine translocase subunit TatC [Syntrophales bacterium]HRT26641.1 twin-arginine translocase subunit TatC [Syntrophales bacterium]HRT69748.1 twin-arginine translocase subunit TatC [Syntrophales bacterium]